MTNDYSLDDIKKMQNEATRQVREMNERGKPNTPGGESRSQTDAQHEPKKQNAPNQNNLGALLSSFLSPPKTNHNPQQEQKKTFGFDFLKNFDIRSLLKNADQSLILMIILMLSGENTDHLLVMALIYIMI